VLLHLCEHAGTTRLDGIDLGLRVGHALEACGKLGAVEVEALACLNRAEGRSRCAANTAGEVARLIQRAVLLRLLPVAGEGLGERVGGGGWVDLRSVVDVYIWLLAADSSASIDGHVRLGVVRLPRKRIMGWRPAWRILVAFIVGWMR
jgi:hypothetical protein